MKKVAIARKKADLMLTIAKIGVLGGTVKSACVDSDASRQRRVVGISEYVFSVVSLKSIRPKQAL